jgi:hypothetical protein
MACMLTPILANGKIITSLLTYLLELVECILLFIGQVAEVSSRILIGLYSRHGGIHFDQRAEIKVLTCCQQDSDALLF